MKVLCFSLLSVALLTPSIVSALPPAGVLEKLHHPAPDVTPAVLFLQSADANEGTGDPTWVAGSGAKLTGRGTDPWGDDTGAFGPADGAVAGAAVTGSADSTLLAGEAGAVVFCVRIPKVTGDPAMILSRGAWGDRMVFDLRADRNGALLLYTGGKQPETLRLGKYRPDTWMFVGLSWKPDGDTRTLEVCLGELGQGASPTVASFPLAQAGDPGSPVLLAGRTNRDLSPALLEGGLFSGVAIYEKPLPVETLTALYEEMLSSARP